MGKVVDLTGKQFGNWLVLSRCEDYIGRNGHKRVRYLCECQCEDKTVSKVLACNLTSGKTKSCGCLKGKLISNRKRRQNEYDLSGDYGKGYTKNGEEFLFDLEDYELILNYCWHTDKCGYFVSAVKTNTNKYTTIKMHRIIMGIDDPKICVDHIGHNKFDNRKENLRLVTNVENARNKRLLDSNTSGVTGVYFNKKSHLWVAQIKYNEKVTVLGRFPNIEDAIAARKEAEEKYFGEYSYDNSMKIYKSNNDIGNVENEKI